MPVYNKSPRRLARNRETQTLRNKRSNATRRERALNDLDKARELEEKPFIGWDGEGYNEYVVSSDGEIDIQHRYMLCGASTGHYVSSRNLTSQEIFDLMLFVRREYPNAVHVGFAFEYDVNMMLRSLESRYIAVLKHAGKVKWRGYTIKHVPHKKIQITKDGVTITIYDVFGFFHSSYLKALDKFSIGNAEILARIKAGKDDRGKFTYSDMARVLPYMMDELKLLPELMDSLRKACYDAGFYITEWHGPGALASYTLRKMGANKWHGKDVPGTVQIGRRYAYAGGRFQDWLCGEYNGPVYTADINSAYAYAVARLPRLDTGKWRPYDASNVATVGNLPEFGLYYVRYDARERGTQSRVSGLPFPLFHRDKTGNLTWPPFVENWYWGPEVKAVLATEPDKIKIIEGWVYESDGTYPFRETVFGAFARRLELQHDRNPAEKAYKWFLASVYGQCAQRVGWNQQKRTAPPSHCLEWAGFITSFCRARVYLSALDVAKRGGLVSIDTDGVTSTVPFDERWLIGGTGENLGEWKLEEWTGILHWQNGIYWLRNQEGKYEDPKTRGIPRGNVGYEAVSRALQDHTTGTEISTECAFTLKRTRFIGYRQSLAQRWRDWRAWKTESVSVRFGGNGKGRHLPAMCGKCRGIPSQRMHRIIHLWPAKLESYPHHLPWLDPKPVPEENIIERFIWEDDTL